ncbi:MAG: hypothetical protein FWC09_00035 [Lachnospiraceae bacterium]|nr:hypothetical protein [Lachnospiraceae bacterium]
MSYTGRYMSEVIKKLNLKREKKKKCVIVSNHGRNDIYIEEMEKCLSGNGFAVMVIKYSDSMPGHKMYQKIEKEDPELVITLDLAGFNLRTDTDYIAYVNLSCPNLHFLTDADTADTYECLGGTLSVAMFFFCLNPETYRYISISYPQVPCVKLVANCEEGILFILDAF